MEPPAYTNCLNLQAASERDPAGACKPDPEDDYSNIYQDIYQDILVADAETRNETVSNTKKEVRAGMLARGQNEYRQRARKLVRRFWPLLVILLLMWCVLLTVMLVKYSELSNKMLTTAELEHSAMVANISSRLQNTEVNLKEAKARLEVDLAGLRARVLVSEAFFRCPVGWKKHESRCYFFSSLEQPWEAARSSCRSQNSDLVVVNTEQEQNFLVQNSNSKNHWLGLSDSAVEGTWLWVSGEPLYISFWHQGEPNNSQNQEDCAVIQFTNKWNDVSCSNNYRWICEKGLL